MISPSGSHQQLQQCLSRTMLLQHVGSCHKLWSLFGSLVQYGTYYLGYPKRDPNFDNQPCVSSLKARIAGCKFGGHACIWACDNRKQCPCMAAADV